MRKFNTAIGLLIGSVLLTIGCQPGTSKKNSDSPGKIVIGASMLSLQSEFVVNVKDALQARAEELGVKLIIVDAERTAEKQVQQVESFISQKVDAIILNPCEVEASSPAIDKAKASGIPIINVNSETRSVPDAFVGSKDEEAAAIAMEHIAQLLNYRGNVLIMDGYMGQAAQIKRSEGAMKVIGKYPNMKVLSEQTAEWDRAKAMTLMENWIQSFGGKIDALFAQNDEMGLGAVQALEHANLKAKVIVVSIDAISDALQAVKSGRLNATVFQNAKQQGYGAIDIAVALVKKQKVESTKKYIPFELVTKDNVDKFIAK